MSSELAEKRSFQEKMQSRIRDSIGELMTDEELKAIIERGVEDALFKPRLVSESYSDKKYGPAVVPEAIDNCLKLQMATQVAKWIDDNPKLLTEAIRDSCIKGAGACLARYLDQRFENMFAAALQQHEMQEHGR